METITIQKEEFDKLYLYKQLVENNLQEELTTKEINQIAQAKKTPIMSKKRQ